MEADECRGDNDHRQRAVQRDADRLIEQELRRDDEVAQMNDDVRVATALHLDELERKRNDQQPRRSLETEYVLAAHADTDRRSGHEQHLDPALGVVPPALKHHPAPASAEQAHRDDPRRDVRRMRQHDDSLRDHQEREAVARNLISDAERLSRLVTLEECHTTQAPVVSNRDADRQRPGGSSCRAERARTRARNVPRSAPYP